MRYPGLYDGGGMTVISEELVYANVFFPRMSEWVQNPNLCRYEFEMDWKGAKETIAVEMLELHEHTQQYIAHLVENRMRAAMGRLARRYLIERVNDPGGCE